LRAKGLCIRCRALDTPHPMAGNGIIELARKCAQNPEGKGLRGQNPDNKGLTCRFLAELFVWMLLPLLGQLWDETEASTRLDVTEGLWISNFTHRAFSVCPVASVDLRLIRTRPIRFNNRGPRSVRVDGVTNGAGKEHALQQARGRECVTPFVQP